MKTAFVNYRFYILLFISLFSIVTMFGQSEASKWKAQIAFGVNMPNGSGFVSGFEGSSVNFPTINLGVQRMFKPQYGVKLDFGYNRIENASSSPYFKINYTRINAQFVYDATSVFTFLPVNIGVVGHAGPGMSFVKPLTFQDNNLSYFNIMAGIEFHYTVSRTFSVYLDTSYIYGVSGDFDPITEGYGSFNGNLFTATIGLSVSLSGCYYCD
ncbi:cell envelope biogenesis protein OmpA [Hanstruepera flava]|uniref:cell envelope biogenesis protein OmpA n=1 Tax=Hanstruepera flava TaxID=2930218 RepID=UPI002028E75C|nr:cell envelope biogenesis protein OmpA [Hanstruepera flava]